jgi:HAD superfamily phosphatase
VQKGFDQVMMTAPVIWRRPDCVFPQPFDSVFFDVDGVLIKTTNSYRAANIAVTEFITGELNGLDWGQREGKQLVTANDIELFKQAGGFNSDWDMCYLLTALSTARLREWKGTALARRSMHEWSQLAYEAAQQGQRGRAWVEQVVPASACIDYATLVDIYNESYWGADELRKRLDLEPRYLPAAPGFVHNEEMLFVPDFFQRLRASGVQHLGMITGRVTAEVESATERMETYCGERWWDVIISADEYLKPDPEALRVAIGQVGALGGLYIGDTADDFELVRRYHLSRQELDPSILSAMVVYEHEVELYRQRGADILVRSVEGLLDVIPSVAR